jgi:hypothetical protein
MKSSPPERPDVGQEGEVEGSFKSFKLRRRRFQIKRPNCGRVWRLQCASACLHSVSGFLWYFHRYAPQSSGPLVHFFLDGGHCRYILVWRDRTGTACITALILCNKAILYSALLLGHSLS